MSIQIACDLTVRGREMIWLTAALRNDFGEWVTLFEQLAGEAMALDVSDVIRGCDTGRVVLVSRESKLGNLSSVSLTVEDGIQRVTWDASRVRWLDVADLCRTFMRRDGCAGMHILAEGDVEVQLEWLAAR